uniref:PGG domain-containing protein n=2 Tax=Chenopodium quinoa TaxID=63459 RepID=A0A803KPT2_CHEQI
MCFARNQDGMNPVHVAAINGQIRVLGELFRARMQAARERANGGETILHLCVKFSQLEALKYLLDVMDAQLVNSKDSDGNTVLHLAVATKQPEMVDCILRNTSIEINALNTNKLTAMDIQTQNRKDSSRDDEEISRSLKVAKALQVKDTLELHNKNNRNWLENQRSALLVVASLIGTMAFQVGINPPGGLWQDDTNLHIAGTSVLATKAPGRYNVLLISNTIGLVSSLSVIILLISGLPYRKLFIGILMFIMWIAVSATTFTYLMAILLIFDLDFYKTKKFDVTPGHWKTLYLSLIVWDCLMALVLLGHTIRFIVKQIRQGEQSSIKLYRRWFTRSTYHPPAV